MDSSQESARRFVRDLIRTTGWTASKLAKEAGMSHTTLCRFLNNDSVKHTLSLRTIDRLRAAAEKGRGRMSECPVHGCDYPKDGVCSLCWNEIKHGDLGGRPAVPHYQQGGIEPIDYIRSHNMNHLEGCIIKYVTRWPFKDDPIGDLKKARDYLNWLIEDAESIPTMPIRAPVPPKEG